MSFALAYTKNHVVIHMLVFHKAFINNNTVVSKMVIVTETVQKVGNVTFIKNKQREVSM